MSSPLLRSLTALACGTALGLCLAAPASAQVSFMEGGATFNVKVTTFKDIPWRTVVRQQYDYSCGSAALATLLHYHYGKPVTEAEVFKAMYATGDQDKIRKVGFSLLDMKRYLEAHGFSADGYKLDMEELADLKAPAIAVISINNYKHFVVIKGIQGGRVLIGDPAQGLKTYSRDEFVAMWNGIVFLVNEGPAQQVVYNRSEEWNPWPKAPLSHPINNASLSDFTRELPPMYQVSGALDIDPYIAGDLPVSRTLP